MLNKYPLWKYVLILAVLAIGFIYSAPNLYPDDPAIQITGASTSLQVNQADLERASKALNDAGIQVKAATLAEMAVSTSSTNLSFVTSSPAPDNTMVMLVVSVAVGAVIPDVNAKPELKLLLDKAKRCDVRC